MSAMQALIELIAGFIVLLAAAALSQFGVDLQTPRKAEREVHRVSDCAEPATATALVSKPSRHC